MRVTVIERFPIVGVLRKRPETVIARRVCPPCPWMPLTQIPIGSILGNVARFQERTRKLASVEFLDDGFVSLPPVMTIPIRRPQITRAVTIVGRALIGLIMPFSCARVSHPHTSPCISTVGPPA
jgi:hypothetical protein